MASSITAADAALFAALTDGSNAAAQYVDDLNKMRNAAFKVSMGNLIKGLCASLTALDLAVDATVGVPSSWAAPAATIVALQGYAAAVRADKQARVVENNGQGGRSVYIFDAEETALGDGTTIVTPTDVVEPAAGRWILAQQDAVMAIPVVNKTGGSLTKNKVVYISGWDATAGRFTIALADSTDRTKQASGVVTATIANNANGVIMSGNVTLTSSGLDTSLAVVGAPVFYSSVGVFTLTAPSGATPYDHVVARVMTLAASGTLRIGVEPARPVAAATTTVAGLQSAADKIKQNNAVAYLSAQFTAAENITGALQRMLGIVRKAGTVIDASWHIEGVATQAPVATPGDDIVVQLKSGATVVAEKTYAAGGTALPAAGVFDALTLSVAPGAVDLAAGASLHLLITQNGVSNIAKAGSFQAAVIPAAA